MKSLSLIMVFFLILLCACGSEGGLCKGENSQNRAADVSSKEKGYDLPIPDEERKEAEADLYEVMNIISDIYNSVDNKDAFETILDDGVILKMIKRLSDYGYVEFRSFKSLP